MVVNMSTVDEWDLFESRDSIEEEITNTEENSKGYRLCDLELLDYSLQGVEAFKIYDNTH